MPKVAVSCPTVTGISILRSGALLAGLFISDIISFFSFAVFKQLFSVLDGLQAARMKKPQTITIARMTKTLHVLT
jgi:hypothetical protein